MLIIEDFAKSLEGVIVAVKVEFSGGLAAIVVFPWSTFAVLYTT